jgi:release factor glutamine methyltransferase
VSTVGELLDGCGLARIDAEVLLAHLLGRNRAWLVAHAADALPDVDVESFEAIARRRRAGEPVAYLTGRREFHGVALDVGPAVLIPRPETETLVDVALARIPRQGAPRVLDLGTGSGAIALAIAHARPEARVYACDLSSEALAVAHANAKRLQLRNLRFFVSDWFASAPALAFDVVVANPPYIAAGDPHLAAGDLRFEPALALSPGGDGLGALRTIVAAAPGHLAPGGLLAVEHGFDQAGPVRAMFATAGFLAVVTHADLAGHARVTSGDARG